MATRNQGKANPCGAYFPVNWQVQNLMPANSDCAGGGNGAHNWWGSGSYVGFDPTGEPGSSGGFCCDMIGRLGNTNQWVYSHNYNPFVTTYAVKGSCKGCPNQAFNQHTSTDDICFNTSQPCRYNLLASAWFDWGCVVAGRWRNTWHQCFFGLEEAFGCTNPNSFGIVTNDTDPGVVGYAGSPNGSCTQNCMQLTQSYFQDWAVGGSSLALADYPPCTFNKKAYFDCEGPEYDAAGSAGVSGAKLIWAGYTPRVNTYGNAGFNYQNDPVTVGTTQYQLVQGNWKGYLNSGHNINNGWGQVGGPPNSTSHLWNRKSGFDVTAVNGPITNFLDFDGCCSFVSFGCQDSTFGSFDSQAQLNCDGRAQLNTVSILPNGDIECFGVNGQPIPCYDMPLNCNACIDPNTLTYYPSGHFNIQPTNQYPLEGDQAQTPNLLPFDPHVCYQQVWDACGGSGTLSASAWVAMKNNRPESHLYGPGQFWDKGGTNVTNNNGTGTNDSLPKCQCNNEGCTNPLASNYSPLNTADCSGVDYDPLNPMTDVSCCTIMEYGCSDPSYNTFPQNNYFCTVHLNSGSVPDNAALCMDPSNGNPCVGIFGNWMCGTGSGVSPLGGIPRNPNLPLGNPTSGPILTNETVVLMDDGSCQTHSVIGCKDDGGVSAGGVWPSPLHPGFSAINFYADATIHTQDMCHYSFGCVDPLAGNYNTTPICGGLTLQDELNVVNLIIGSTNNGQPPLISTQPILDNLIPNITCCDYSLPGEGAGCMDPNALNYNPNATQDCITLCATSPFCCCTYNIEGCTDPLALNFNPNATLDDGTCIYSLDFPEEGTNFLDGSLVELCREPLVKEEVLMNVCQPTEIQSEVFIERGKQSVFETNQRLGEVNTIGGLQIYGYGFYNIKEQI